MPGGGEPGHVCAGLRDHRIDNQPIEARDLLQQRPRCRVGPHPDADLLGQRRDAGIQAVDVGQHLRGGHRVMRAEVPGQRLGQLRDLRPQLSLGQLRQNSGRVQNSSTWLTIGPTKTSSTGPSPNTCTRC
jgi:hypothetical protein